MAEEMTVIERAAAAVYTEYENRPIYAQGQMNGLLARELVIAVLQAIREPSEGMIMAGMDYDERELNIKLGRAPTCEECQAGEWAAMLDAALAE